MTHVNGFIVITVITNFITACHARLMCVKTVYIGWLLSEGRELLYNKDNFEKKMFLVSLL